MAAVKISNKLVALSLVVIAVGVTVAAATTGLFDWRAAAGKLPVVGKQINPPPKKTPTTTYSPLQLENDKLKKEISGLTARLNRSEEELSGLRTEKEGLQVELEKLQTEASERDETEKGYEKLALLYNEMKPATAAAVIAKLDNETALGVLNRMEPGQASKVIGALDPELAATLTKLMAAVPEPEP
jgi:flagellar motility protein MotE (MotC chaperone)